jgi:DNA topoisomerase-1
MVWLASDEDREGSYFWHLAEELKLDKKNKTIVFMKLQNRYLKAIDNPREIDYNLVNAQQARRVLDRLVGYELSPVLWRKKRTFRSCAICFVRFVERERDIQNFNAIASYSIVAEFTNETGKSFKAKQNFNTKKKPKFLNNNIGSTYKVADLETNQLKKSPTGPLLLQRYNKKARKLYLPVGITMQLAQRLYEAGLITYENG